MKDTMQFNIRLPKQLVYDMEYISQNLGIDRNDWLKFRIAELISKEIREKKITMMKESEGRFILGSITEKEFTKRMGFKPTKEMKELKEKEKISFKKGNLSTRRYLRDIAKKTKDKKFFDDVLPLKK